MLVCLFRKIPSVINIVIPKPTRYARATLVTLEPRVVINKRANKKGKNISKKPSKEKGTIS